MYAIRSYYEAERTRREAKGQADAILLKYQAEAEGIRKVLDSKAAGYLELVKGCNGDAKAAATLLMTEKIEEIVKMQVEAIRNIKIDKVTVWDSAGGNREGGTTTSNFRITSYNVCYTKLLRLGSGRGNLKIPYACVEEIRAALARRHG